MVRAYLAAFAGGDADVIASHVSADFVNEHTAVLGSGCEGREEYRRRLPGFLSAMPQIHYDLEDLIADADRVWAAYVLHAHVNDSPIAIRGVMRFRVDGGRIAHRVDYWDSLMFQRQAGLA